jgi:hypothetical protein
MELKFWPLPVSLDSYLCVQSKMDCLPTLLVDEGHHDLC